jgi:hypothetical protein
LRRGCAEASADAAQSAIKTRVFMVCNAYLETGENLNQARQNSNPQKKKAERAKPVCPGKHIASRFRRRA